MHLLRNMCFQPKKYVSSPPIISNCDECCHIIKLIYDVFHSKRVINTLYPCHTIAYDTSVCQSMNKISHTLVHADKR